MHLSRNREEICHTRESQREPQWVHFQKLANRSGFHCVELDFFDIFIAPAPYSWFNRDCRQRSYLAHKYELHYRFAASAAVQDETGNFFLHDTQTRHAQADGTGMRTKLISANVLKAFAMIAVFLSPMLDCEAQPSSLRDEITGHTIDSTATKVIVLIHGWNPEDTMDKYTPNNPEWFSLVTALKSKLTGSDWKLVTYHWEQQGTVSPSIGANTGDILWENIIIGDLVGYGNATVAAVHAEQQGTYLSSVLNNQAPGLRKVHFIAHSAGSWAAREAMRLLLVANPNVVCQMTLLDPFIPDASFGMTTGLSTSKMNSTATFQGNTRIQRLESYYADDGVSQCSPVLVGTISTPGQEFVWRGSDLNLRVDWGSTGFSGLSLWYDCHSGPVQFYADTVNSTGSSYTSLGLLNPDFDLDTVGWKASLFYQEQQLRATITSVSPATLPTSSSPQPITINGTNFKPSGDPNASSLIFYDPANTAYPRTPINVTTTSMQYNLNVQSAAGTWKVKVVSGGVESLPFSFAVTSSGAQLTGLSISGPATVAENSSGQFTATAYFSDDSSSTVTSSTSWNENSSATTISASGLLSAGSVTSDTAVTVSASYTLNGITKSTSGTVTVVNSGSGGGTTTIYPLVNGTFESGVSPWSPSGYADIVALSYPHLGSWYAYLCNANSADGAFAQLFVVPAGTTSATIQFYLNVVSSETSTTTEFDYMNVDLGTSGEQYVGRIAHFSNLDKGGNVNGSYILKSYNITSFVTPYAGQSLYLTFAGHTDATFSTIFRIDDVDITLTVNNPVSLTGLSIRGPSCIPEGRGDTFWADAIFSDGTTQTISPNSWTENSSVTTITSDGFLSAGSVSSDTAVTVAASYTFNGVTQQATKSVTIVDTNATHTLTSLAFSGPSSMNENSSGQFTATAIFADGTSQSVTPTWSENSSVTTISSGGLLNAGEVIGDTTVTVAASYTTGGVTRNASQDVIIINVPTPPTLASLTISGPNSLNENTTAQYYATAAFSDGTSQVVTPSWSEDSAATGIGISGMLNAGEVASETSVTISASYTVGGITRSAQKSVTVLNTTGLPVYTLTLYAVNGAVAKNPYQPNFVSGSQVVLTAKADNGYQFSNWSGDASGNLNPLTLTMDGNKNITANFTPISVSPQLAVSPPSGLISTGNLGGPFAPASETYTVSNTEEGMLNWTASADQNWVTVSPTVGQDSGSVTVSLNANANSLSGSAAGTLYTATVNFGGNGGTTTRQVQLTVYSAPPANQLSSITYGNDIFRFVLNGPVGSNYVIQVSSNLVDWVPLSTNTIPVGGSVPIIDPGMSSHSRRFYRVVPAADSVANDNWAIGSGGTSDDSAIATTIGPNGVVYVTGVFRVSASFGTTNLVSRGGNDVYVAAYDATGRLLWVTQAGGAYEDAPQAIAVDAQGNAFVSGTFQTEAVFGTNTLIGGYSGSLFVAKFDPTGQVVWAYAAGAGSNHGAFGLCSVDKNGDLYVGGFFSGQASFWDGYSKTSRGWYDIFVMKVSTEGHIQWLNTLGDGSDCWGTAVAVDANSNSFVAGQFGHKFFLAKFDNTGGQQWFKQADTYTIPPSIVADDSGGVYFVGTITGSANFGAISVTNAGGEDGIIGHYDASGQPVWVRTFGGVGNDGFQSIAWDNDSNLLVTGSFENTVNIGATNLTSDGGKDVLIAKFSPDGTPLWASQVGGSGAAEANGIAADKTGHIWVVGDFSNTLGYGGTTLSSAGGTDAFIIKLANPSIVGTDQAPSVLLRKGNGVFLYSRSLNDYDVVCRTGPALGDDGRFYVTASTDRLYQGVVAFDSDSLDVAWGPIKPCASFAESGVSVGANGLVYTVGDWNWCGNGALVAIDSNGTIIWQDVNGSPHPRQIPALDEQSGTVFFGSSTIEAIDWNDHSCNWASSEGSYIGDRGIGIDAAGNLYVGTHSGAGGSTKILSFSQTGALRWSRTIPAQGGPRIAAIPNPQIVLLYHQAVNQLLAWNANDGSDVWQVANLDNPITDPAGNLFASAVTNSDIVSLTQTGQERWRCSLSGVTNVALDFIDNDGQLYVRGDRTLFAIKTADGTVAWRFVADATLVIPAALARGGRIYLHDSTGMNYLLDTALDYAPSTWPVAQFGNRRHTQKSGDALLPLITH